MNQRDILQTLRDHKSHFAERYGVRAVGLFGSFARDEATSDSDIDVVLEMTTPNPFWLVAIKEELEQATQHSVDVVRFRPSMNRFLKQRIEKEVVYV